MEKPFVISGTGCALVDYLYKPVNFSDESFRGYMSKKSGDGGLAPGKLVFTQEFEAFSNEKYDIIRHLITKGKEPVSVNIGGPSIVSLIHAAQLLYNTHAEVYFYGSKGDDPGGKFIEENLKKTPLKAGNYKIVSNYTPYTDVFSDPAYDEGHGERIFINNIGAAGEFYPEDLDDRFFQSDLVVFGGTALVPHIHQSLEEILERAKGNNAVTIVNTVYDFISEKQDSVKPWSLGKSTKSYTCIDLLITDREEALRLSGSSDIEEAIGFFRSKGVGAAIITQGAAPVYYFAQNDLFGHLPVSQLPVSAKIVRELKENPEKKGDTTGCGDNFVGGVIASLVLQLKDRKSTQANLKEAISMGIVSGGFTCFYNGGTYYESFKGEKAGIIEDYLRNYKEQIDEKG